MYFASNKVHLKKRKSLALLALLVLTPELKLSREDARSVLWPDSEEAAAQTSLRNAIWTIKSVFKKCGFAGFQTNRNEIWIENGLVVTDFDQYSSEIESGLIGNILVCRPKDVAFFNRAFGIITDTFAKRMEDNATHIVRQLLSKLAAHADQSKSGQERLSIYQFIAEIDPLDEAAARNLIEEYWKNGQQANALTAYQSLWNILDQEFGEEPSADTQALIVRVKSEETEKHGSTNENSRPRILVAPGNFASLDQLSLSYAENVRDELCANLTRFREWKVFDSEHISDINSLVRKGGRSYILSLHPTVHENAHKYRMVLADAVNGELLWSSIIDSSYTSRPNERADIARKLAVALNLHLAAYRGAANSLANSEPDPYELWVEAHGLILQFKTWSWSKAEQILDRLILDYPSFSRGYSSRASIENMRQISFPGSYSTPDMHLQALKLARKAIELDPMDSRGQLAMGWSAGMSRQFEQAELAFDLAFQYNENDPWTITSSAVGLAFCDRLDAANRLLDILFGLEFELEATHWSYVAATHFMDEQYHQCVLASQKSEEVSHDVPAWHAAALALLGRNEEAADVARRFRKIVRENWSVPGPVSSSEITRWILSGFPIRNLSVRAALREGLCRAGMQLPDLVQSELPKKTKSRDTAH